MPQLPASQGRTSKTRDIPTWKLEVIHMDFITGLPRTREQLDSIRVIVDRMTKSSRFLVVKTTDSTEDYAKLYINEILRLHGVPLSIILDRVPQFTSHSESHFRRILVLRLTIAQHIICRRKDRKIKPFRT